ncbi:hypothetical protein ABE47_05720, partial [Bacillus thuringiensis]|uniref:hypothetical protein n=1 Tax=Bacillus thuringiensis TaxID=1428 RepID=UPI0018CFBDAF
TGATGTDGVTGPTGATGTDGVTGPTGATGGIYTKSMLLTNKSSSVSLDNGDIVSFPHKDIDMGDPDISQVNQNQIQLLPGIYLVAWGISGSVENDNGSLGLQLTLGGAPIPGSRVTLGGEAPKTPNVFPLDTTVIIKVSATNNLSLMNDSRNAITLTTVGARLAAKISIVKLSDVSSSS